MAAPAASSLSSGSCDCDRVRGVRRRCRRLTHWVPVLCICGLVAWSYYATSTSSACFYLSYADKELMERESGSEIHQEVLKRAAKDLPISTRTMSGAIGYCDRCQLIKPDRCHHCSACEECILKMDHHCPWLNNCVGFSNYKFFLLFLAYSLLYCLFIVATDFQYFIKFWAGTLPDTQAKSHILYISQIE